MIRRTVHDHGTRIRALPLKPTKVKAWPELVGFQPSLMAFRESRPKTSRGNPAVEVDFAAVRAVTSTGLAVFMMRLLRILGDNRKPQLRRDCSPQTWARLDRLGAFTLLGDVHPNTEY